mmetsp:Transcript_18739/g.27071  ORF Transcript_18739/g.27071 Transcript_18739/m.27071 type:complete len:183 (-) Transcript_18739:361-909(-)
MTNLQIIHIMISSRDGATQAQRGSANLKGHLKEAKKKRSPISPEHLNYKWALDGNMQSEGDRPKQKNTSFFNPSPKVKILRSASTTSRTILLASLMAGINTMRIMLLWLKSSNDNTWLHTMLEGSRLGLHNKLEFHDSTKYAHWPNVPNPAYNHWFPSAIYSSLDVCIVALNTFNCFLCPVI